MGQDSGIKVLNERIRYLKNQEKVYLELCKQKDREGNKILAEKYFEEAEKIGNYEIPE